MILPTGRLLILGHPGVSWKEWLRQNRGERELILLDPADSTYGFPARLSRLQGDKVVDWRFYGSLDPQRAPHVILAALAQFLAASPEDAIVQLAPYRPRPLVRQLNVLIAQVVQPEQIFVGEGIDISLEGWPVGPQEVALEKSLELVQTAQRKAQWIKLIEESSHHEIDLQHVSISGGRLGSGHLLNESVLKQAGLEGVLRAETSAKTLLIVSEGDLSESQIARALDVTHTKKADVVHPDAYCNLLCSFARQDGEDFGMGMIEEIDFEKWSARILSTAVPPAPVRILKLGSLRVDAKGNEVGEVKPWQL